MIARTSAASSRRRAAGREGAAASPPASWQRELADGVASVGELLALLDLPAAAAGGAAGAARAAAEFPVRVPRGFVARMRPGDPRDPLLLQVLAAAAEVEPAPGWEHDPLAEADQQPVPGVLHKYRGRALLVVTGACAVHCRYCFRRHVPYGERSLTRSAEERALAWLAGEPSIEEVILSGGDPLTLPDRRLADLAERLAAIPHLRRLRLHTRLPIVLPGRVDDALLAWLGGTRLAPVVVVHANHAREIDAAVAAAVGRLAAAGIPVLNQSVLLAGVNDSPEALADLSRALFAAGALPYYLHLLDRVAGAAGFDVPEPRARALHAELAARLPGYLLPRLVREVPGAAGKVGV
ncbi:MAG TPA: EF-P beta-lysylation protein EpmB [Thermoanaerobaculia bacterium]